MIPGASSPSPAPTTAGNNEQINPINHSLTSLATSLFRSLYSLVASSDSKRKREDPATAEEDKEGNKRRRPDSLTDSSKVSHQAIKRFDPELKSPRPPLYNRKLLLENRKLISKEQLTELEQKLEELHANSADQKALSLIIENGITYSDFDLLDFTLSRGLDEMAIEIYSQGFCSILPQASASYLLYSPLNISEMKCSSSY